MWSHKERHQTEAHIDTWRDRHIDTLWVRRQMRDGDLGRERLRDGKGPFEGAVKGGRRSINLLSTDLTK